MTTPKRVLIVDDETKILFIFRRALALLGPECHIETLSTGAEALEAARHTHFDLVIADFGMPDMDGIALTEALRALPQDPIVVWMNACDCGVTREDAQRLGVYRCLDKPLEVADIRRVVSGALWDAPQSAYTPAVQLIKRD